MLDLVTKFLGWIKDIFTLIVSLPSKFAALASFVGDMLGFLPNGVGTIVAGLLITCITFVIVYAIVKLVVDLL